MDLDKISPSMSKEELDRVRQEILRVVRRRRRGECSPRVREQ